MLLTGNHIVNASASTVWLMLMDPDVLAKVVPGISELQKISDNSFKSILNIKIGPVSSSFAGSLQLEDMVEQKSFTLKAQQNSKIGNANAVVKINLSAVSDAETEVKFDGDVKISGMLATMGQRLLGGVANALTKQFFENLDKEIIAKESPMV
ncbi:MAG TPA: carbon monoxide dehydrogenase subunit G [Segetibacter sp.]|nr:carbon monoxide dehydrogenase subunit G [Segetibacter sp.]